ncbi:hypothetical protein OTU49_017462 [Cherax quadricarinatus]|uniref:Uncharacterized protein n=1 Tax=Cherax quadricarinatus TaxID=27406 RepID=A0AAW0YMN5_CHEQU
MVQCHDVKLIFPLIFRGAVVLDRCVGRRDVPSFLSWCRRARRAVLPVMVQEGEMCRPSCHGAGGRDVPSFLSWCRRARRAVLPVMVQEGETCRPSCHGAGGRDVPSFLSWCRRARHAVLPVMVHIFLKQKRSQIDLRNKLAFAQAA